MNLIPRRPQSPAAQAFVRQRKAAWKAEAQALAIETAWFIRELYVAVRTADEKALCRLAGKVNSLRQRHKNQGEDFQFDVLLGEAFESITPQLLLHATKLGKLPPITGVIPRGVERSHRDFTLQLPGGRTVDLDVKTTAGKNVCLETETEGGNVGWFPKMPSSQLILSPRIDVDKTQLLLIPVRSLRQPQPNGEPWWLTNARPGQCGRRERHNRSGRGIFYLLPPEKVEKLPGVVDLTQTWRDGAVAGAW